MAKRNLWRVLGLVVLGIMAGWAWGQEPVEPKREGSAFSFDTAEAPVLKVFSAADEDYRFVAYAVNWQGSEVVVIDPLARSDFQEGDRIRFMVHRMRLPEKDGVRFALNFMLASQPDATVPDPAEDGRSPAEKERMMRVVGGDLSAARDEEERFYALGPAAKNALREGKTDEARKYATELEGMLPTHKAQGHIGSAIQDANQVLGRIALAEGKVEEAKNRLLASADSKGSPVLNSFGPNMQLAKDLLEKGEKDVVLEYFKRCGTFWEMGEDKLAAWTEAVRQGKIPDFGANLKY